MAQRTLRQALLPVVDRLRGIPGRLDLRRYAVSIVVRSWDDSRVGLGNNTDVEKKILVDLGTFSPKVTRISSKDIIASGGLYTDQDLKVGPITPPFKGSTADNSDTTAFDPTPGSSGAEVFFRLIGPGLPAAGDWYKKIGQDVTRNFGYTFVVRKTAEIP